MEFPKFDGSNHRVWRDQCVLFFLRYMGPFAVHFIIANSELIHFKLKSCDCDPPVVSWMSSSFLTQTPNR
jgi:hypothetical protein